MRLYFLGTSAGVPTLQRNVTSLAINHQGQKSWDLVDCGEATQHQIMRSVLSLNKIKRIFITHLHGDHIYGLPGLLATRSFQASSSIEIYGPVGIKEYVEGVLRISKSRIHYEINFYEFSEGGKIIENEKEVIHTIALDHDVPSFAYCFEQKDKVGEFLVDKAIKDDLPHGKLFGKLKSGEKITLEDGRVIDGHDYIGEPERGIKMVVGGDNCCPELLQGFLEGADIFIHESTHTRESAGRVTYENKHSCAYQVAEVANKCKVPHLILTHFSSRFVNKNLKGTYNIDDIYEEAKQTYEGILFLAKDHQEFLLTKDKKLRLR